MKMGKYVVRKGRFVHESDTKSDTRGSFPLFPVLAVALLLWYFLLVGIGVIPFWPFL